MENFNQNQINYDIAKSRVNSLKKFYLSLAFFGLFVIFWWIKDFVTGNSNHVPIIKKPHYILCIWGLFLTVRAIKLFVFNTQWEKEMIFKELKK